jgi:acyl carrier protein
MNKLYIELSDLLEVQIESITDEKMLRDFPGWSSLKAFALLTFLEEEYSIEITISDLNNIKTISDLKKIIPDFL